MTAMAGYSAVLTGKLSPARANMTYEAVVTCKYGDKLRGCSGEGRGREGKTEENGLTGSVL